MFFYILRERKGGYTFLAPHVDARNLHLVRLPRLKRNPIVYNFDVRAVDVELRVQRIRKDVLPANEVLSRRRASGDGKVPLYTASVPMPSIYKNKKLTLVARKVPQTALLASKYGLFAGSSKSTL